MKIDPEETWQDWIAGEQLHTLMDAMLYGLWIILVITFFQVQSYPY